MYKIQDDFNQNLAITQRPLKWKHAVNEKWSGSILYTEHAPVTKSSCPHNAVVKVKKHKH